MNSTTAGDRSVGRQATWYIKCKQFRSLAARNDCAIAGRRSPSCAGSPRSIQPRLAISSIRSCGVCFDHCGAGNGDGDCDHGGANVDRGCQASPGLWTDSAPPTGPLMEQVLTLGGIGIWPTPN
jgi:hypothetical protein